MPDIVTTEFMEEAAVGLLGARGDLYDPALAGRPAGFGGLRADAAR